MHIRKQQQWSWLSSLSQLSKHNSLLGCAVDWNREVIQLFQAWSSASCSSSQNIFATQLHKLLCYHSWGDIMLKYGAGTCGRKVRILQDDPVGKTVPWNQCCRVFASDKESPASPLDTGNGAALLCPSKATHGYFPWVCSVVEPAFALSLKQLMHH